jgi:hypothetical protein
MLKERFGVERIEYYYGKKTRLVVITKLYPDLGAYLRSKIRQLNRNSRIVLEVCGDIPF